VKHQYEACFGEQLEDPGYVQSLAVVRWVPPDIRRQERQHVTRDYRRVVGDRQMLRTGYPAQLGAGDQLDKP